MEKKSLTLRNRKWHSLPTLFKIVIYFFPQIFLRFLLSFNLNDIITNQKKKIKTDKFRPEVRLAISPLGWNYGILNSCDNSSKCKPEISRTYHFLFFFPPPIFKAKVERNSKCLALYWCTHPTRRKSIQLQKCYPTPNVLPQMCT